MKRALFVLLGSGFFSVVGFFCASGLSYLYEHQFAKSQEDMNSFAVILVLFVIPTFALGGGALGLLLHQNLTRRSSGRPESRR